MFLNQVVDEIDNSFEATLALALEVSAVEYYGSTDDQILSQALLELRSH